MGRLQSLREEDEERLAANLDDLKTELKRIASRAEGNLQTTQEFINYLAWCQYEGIPLSLRDSYSYLTHCVLLLIAEQLAESDEVSLLKCHDELVIVHSAIAGVCPLELLAYRPAVPGEGSWADSDLISRALFALEAIQDALRSRVQGLNWSQIVLGKEWSWVLQHKTPIE